MDYEFPSISLPFDWYPPVQPGERIEWVDTIISVYPDFHPIWHGSYYAVRIYLRFLEGAVGNPRVLPMSGRVCFYQMRFYPPANSKPIGIRLWSGSQAIKIRGTVHTTL